MRSFSDQFLLTLPAFLAVLFVMLFCAPVQLSNISFAPNVAWVMSLIMVSFYPTAWPRGFAFALGLLQDVLFGTPLGSQALLTVLLVELVHSQARRQHYQQFRVRWLEAAGVLIVWHILLWLVIRSVTGEAPPLRPLMRTGLMSVLWYPILYAPLRKLIHWLPAVK